MEINQRWSQGRGLFQAARLGHARVSTSRRRLSCANEGFHLHDSNTDTHVSIVFQRWNQTVGVVCQSLPERNPPPSHRGGFDAFSSHRCNTWCGYYEWARCFPDASQISAMSPPERGSSKWECKRWEGERCRLFRRSIFNTEHCCCVVAPIRSTPVDTGSVVVQQHTARTQATGGKPGGALWCIGRLFRCGLRPDGLVAQKCVTPSCRRLLMWCDAHNDSKPPDTRRRVVSAWTAQRSLTTLCRVN